MSSFLLDFFSSILFISYCTCCYVYVQSFCSDHTFFFALSMDEIFAFFVEMKRLHWWDTYAVCFPSLPKVLFRVLSSEAAILCLAIFWKKIFLILFLSVSEMYLLSFSSFVIQWNFVCFNLCPLPLVLWWVLLRRALYSPASGI